MVSMFGGLIDIVVLVAMIVIASAFHETAHAWAAWRCGDHTAKDLGRITLNPIAHISLFDSIALPILLFIMSNGSFIFGGAKPVPVVVQNLRNPDRDMAFTAAAGPMANLIIVLVASILALIFKPFMTILIGSFIRNMIYLNLLLAIFNLLPIAPLDGSRIARYLIPDTKEIYDNMDQWGLVIVLAIVVCFPGFLSFIKAIIDSYIQLLDYVYINVPW